MFAIEQYVSTMKLKPMKLKPLLITVFILVSTNVDRSFSESNLNKSWYDAQNYCQLHGSKLKDPSLTTNGTFWTPLHTRYSNWLRILGCYSKDHISSTITSTTETMEQPSAGMCEEICERYGSNIFALRNDTCKCLDSMISAASRLSPSECNYTCNYQVDKETFYECGGTSTYNVFLSDVSNPLHMHNRCVSIQCGQSSKVYLEKSCTTTIVKVCHKNEKPEGTPVSWRESMNICKTEFDSYLFGYLPFGNESVMCEAINVTLTGPTWIGIATQIYISSDQGNRIENQTFVYDCQTCTIIDSNVTCRYTNCSENNSFTCEKIPTTTTTKTTQNSRTTTTQSGTTKVTTSEATNVAINTTKDSHVNRNSNQQDSNEDGVLVGILVTVTVLTVAGVVIGIIVLKRRQTNIPKNVKAEGLKNELPEIQKNKIYNESDNSANNNYFVLELPKSNYEVPDDNTQESESPYTDGEEGTYDHLRDKESRRKTTNNVYQHAHCLQKSESSDYDFAGRAQNQEIENPYYDHANENTRNSDYGYNTLDRS